MSAANYQLFINRLAGLKEKALPEKFLICMDQAATHALIDRIINSKKLAKRLKSLKPNGAIRLKKTTKEKRTICILKDPNGEYRLIVETKSKKANHEKHRITKFLGGSRLGKPAWRLDGEQGPEEYISLLEKIKPKENNTKINLKSKVIQEKVKSLREEVSFPWSIPENDFIPRSVMGALYSNKRGVQQAMYSPLGIPLASILDPKNAYKIQLTLQEKHDISLQLIKGMDFLHKQGFIHQDIKPENIIVFKNNGKYKVQIIDFEMMTGGKFRHEPSGTVSYESPEIAMAYGHEAYFSDFYKKSGESLGKYCIDRYNLPKRNKFAYLASHPANDIWALGITLYQLYHQGERPVAVPSNTPFTYLLHPNRSERATAEQALTLWQQATAPKVTVAAKTAAPPMPVFNSKPKVKILTRAARNKLLEQGIINQRIPVPSVPVNAKRKQTPEVVQQVKSGITSLFQQWAPQWLLGQTTAQSSIDQNQNGHQMHKRQRV